MEPIKLVFPTEAHLEDVARFRRELLEDGCDISGCGSLASTQNLAVWLRETEALRNPETVQEGQIQSTQFLGVHVSDGTLVGMIQVRHHIEGNDYLRLYSGHIGYSVRPGQRKKGYATEMLRQALNYCRELGLKRVLMTCWPYNEGSKRAILNNGGVFESERYEPYEDDMFYRYWIEL